MEHTKLAEEIALKYGLCTCDEVHKSRGLVAPDCPWHSFPVQEAMEEYAARKHSVTPVLSEQEISDAIDFGNSQVWTKGTPVYEENKASYIAALTAQHKGLRQLSDITEQELKECGNLLYDFSDDPDPRMREFTLQDIKDGPLFLEQFQYLLSRGFDLTAHQTSNSVNILTELGGKQHTE